MRISDWSSDVCSSDLAERFLDGKMSLKELGERSRPFHKKIRKQLLKDYVLFPLLTFWNAPRVLLGNLIANLIRNLWSYAIIFCGHFPEGTAVFSEADSENETRGDWCYPQLRGSAKIQGTRAFHVHSAHFTHQHE